MTVDRNKLITIAGLDNFRTRLMDEISEGLDSNLSKAEDYEVDNYIFDIKVDEDDPCPSPDADDGAHDWTGSSGNWECSLCGATSTSESNPNN